VQVSVSCMEVNAILISCETCICRYSRSNVNTMRSYFTGFKRLYSRTNSRHTKSGQLATISCVIERTAMSKAYQNLQKLARKLHSANNHDRPPLALSVFPKFLLTLLAGHAGPITCVPTEILTPEWPAKRPFSLDHFDPSLTQEFSPLKCMGN